MIRELRDKVTSTDQMRAIGFCVSVQHAHYLAEVFNRAGIASVAVSGETEDGERALALQRLASRELNCAFAVDSTETAIHRRAHRQMGSYQTRRILATIAAPDLSSTDGPVEAVPTRTGKIRCKCKQS